MTRSQEVYVNDELLRPAEAAFVLKVSKAYLRASDCPKVLLPPNRGKRATVRYRRSEILAWASHWTTRKVQKAG